MASRGKSFAHSTFEVDCRWLYEHRYWHARSHRRIGKVEESGACYYRRTTQVWHSPTGRVCQQADRGETSIWRFHLQGSPLTLYDGHANTSHACSHNLWRPRFDFARRIPRWTQTHHHQNHQTK